MGTIHGKAGVVRVGANPVAEVTEFTIETSVALADDTVMGDAWETHQIGVKKWSGSINCFWDEGDTNGQVVLDEGAAVTLNLYPDGVATGKKYVTGTATIESTSTGVPKDGVATRSFTFTGNGAMSWSTAP
jgi:lipopolysaccharide biosynthesis protein